MYSASSASVYSWLSSASSTFHMLLSNVKEDPRVSFLQRSQSLTDLTSKLFHGRVLSAPVTWMTQIPPFSHIDRVVSLFMTVFSFFSFSLFMTVFSFISFSLFMTVVSFFRISYPVVQCKRRSKGFLPTEVPVAHWSDVQTLPRPGSFCACYLDDTDPTLLTYWSGCHLPPKVCAWQNAAGVSFPGQVIYWSAHTHLRARQFSVNLN